MSQHLEHQKHVRSIGAIFAAPMVLASLLGLILICAVSPIRAQNMDPMHKSQGKESLVMDKDRRTGDRVIMVSPPAVEGEESTMTIHREPGTGDQIIHVSPPPEREQDPGVVGPLFITPEITWPEQRKSPKGQ